MSKRLVVCCDGTWNTPDKQDGNGESCATNVAKIALTVAPSDLEGREQRVFYFTGVGTGRFERFRGGVFGTGISEKIKEAYRCLVMNYDQDDEIFLFGFSRGAYTARSLAGLIRNSGVLKRDYAHKVDSAYALYRSRNPDTHPRGTESVLFRRSFSVDPKIRFIGVWDTVGALGIPGGFRRVVNWWNQFHDVELSTRIEHAYHALAIDEQRRSFAPTLWKKSPDAPASQILEQVWFPGVHSDVGGGYARTGLSDVALCWMIHRAHRCRLHFDAQRLAELKIDPKIHAEAHDSRDGVFGVFPGVPRELGALLAKRSHESLADTARERMQSPNGLGYAPENLRKFLGAKPEIAEVSPLLRLPPP